MNSSEVPSSNGILQEEETASGSISTADDNANVNDGIDRSRGAIPKIKTSKPSDTSARKNVKLNNNLDDMQTLNGVSLRCVDIEKRNGCDKRTTENAYDSESRENMCNKSPESYFHTLCLDKKNIKEDSDNSSDDTELLSISDDGCIYTYKGDNVADLPESFFSLEIPALENQDVAQEQQRESSPEMDFLEMDFDPGPAGDVDSDSVSNSEVEQVKFAPVDSGSEKKDEVPVPAPCSKNQKYLPTAVVLPSQNQSVIQNVTSTTVVRSLENRKSQETQPRIIEHIKMPWSCSPSQRTTASKAVRTMKRHHNSSGELVSPVDQPTPTVLPHFIRPLPSVNKTMIWSEQEAKNLQVTQIGASACGATAVLNVLKALRFPLPSREKLQEVVKTKLRASSSPLVEYLLSRSAAGTTHEDLIQGLQVISNGRIYARHFPMHPERLLNLNTWLAFWMENGAVPIATLNLQKGVEPMPDAWHHQMIFGVGPEGVHLTNPLECVRAEELWPQLCSEPVLMVKREDVLPRWCREEFVRLMRVRDVRWRRMNVVGQVARMVQESWQEHSASFSRMSHIAIPANYSAGITLVVNVNSPAFELLSGCPELPLLQDQFSLDENLR